MKKILSFILVSSIASTTAFAGTTGIWGSNHSSVVWDGYKLGRNILINVIDAPLPVK